MNIVQVVGGPGSGKTTLVRQLVEDWPETASLLRIERYLRDRQSGDGDDFLLLPTSIDWPLITAHIDQLAAGNRVIMPGYDLHTGVRQTGRLPAPPEQVIEPRAWLIVEGLFYIPGVQSFRLFVDAPAEVRRERAQARDTRISQGLEGIYDLVAEPAYEKYILPQRDLADHVLDGTLSREELADRARRVLASMWAGWG